MTYLCTWPARKTAGCIDCNEAVEIQDDERVSGGGLVRVPIIRIILMAIWLGFLAALLMVSTKAHAQDSWSGSDKRMHAGVSALIGIGARQVWRDEPLKAWGVALIPGIIKEATDTKPSAKDMVANALGAALGVYTGGLFVVTNGDQVVVGYSTEF